MYTELHIDSQQLLFKFSCNNIVAIHILFGKFSANIKSYWYKKCLKLLL